MHYFEYIHRFYCCIHHNNIEKDVFLIYFRQIKWKSWSTFIFWRTSTHTFLSLLSLLLSFCLDISALTVQCYNGPIIIWTESVLFINSSFSTPHILENILACVGRYIQFSNWIPAQLKCLPLIAPLSAVNWTREVFTAALNKSFQPTIYCYCQFQKFAALS